MPKELINFIILHEKEQLFIKEIEEKIDEWLDENRGEVNQALRDRYNTVSFNIPDIDISSNVLFFFNEMNNTELNESYLLFALNLKYRKCGWKNLLLVAHRNEGDDIEWIQVDLFFKLGKR